MVKKITIALIMLICVNICLAQNEKNAQTRPNFSGVWIFESEESNPKSNAKLQNDGEIQITYNEPELKMTRVVKRDGDTILNELTYYTDGRGETHALQSKTKWDGKKILIKYPKDNTEVLLELSPDGNKLFETTTIKVTITIEMFGTKQTRTNKSVIKLTYLRKTTNS